VARRHRKASLAACGYCGGLTVNWLCAGGGCGLVDDRVVGMNPGAILYALHRILQGITLPIREARSKAALRRITCDTHKAEAEARRRHRAVQPIRQTRMALVNASLRRAG